MSERIQFCNSDWSGVMWGSASADWWVGIECNGTYMVVVVVVLDSGVARCVHCERDVA